MPSIVTGSAKFPVAQLRQQGPRARAPHLGPAIPNGNLLLLRYLACSPTVMTSSLHHPAQRAEALARLQRFVPLAGSHYTAQRNFDHGPEQRTNVSLLSPYLRHRLVLEEEVLAAVLAEHSVQAAEHFVQEVCWRTYWKGWLEMRPAVWSHYLEEVQRHHARLARESDLARRYERATSGQTGIEAMDFWAGELISTGYLHNHARMWFASLWIYTLELPWALGADFFLRHLLDGDPASNTLSWRWVCGLQTRGKTYLARRENIAKFTAGRFTPDAARLAAQAPPLAAPEPPAPVAPPAPELDWEEPVRDPCALLLTEEDLHSESWPIRGEVTAIAGWLLTERRGLHQLSGIGDATRRFAQGAMSDGLQRASHAYADAPTTVFDHSSPAEIVGWCRDQGIDRLVTTWAPVGPTSAPLAELRTHAADASVVVQRLRRPWDDAAWPQARRGFFAFKKHLPELLAHLPA